MDDSAHCEARIRRVTFAMIRRGAQTTLLEGMLIEDIRKALDPVNKVSRYRRIWRVSRMAKLEGTDYFGGKLGFSSKKPSEQVTYDEKKGDFVSKVSESEQCVFSHFVLYAPKRFDEAWLLFEERPPDIRRQSFIGALQGLLDGSGMSFKVSVDREPVRFKDWVTQVERITEFKGQAHVPNPGYQGRVKQLETILEETHAETVKLTAKAASSGPGLAVEDSVLGAFVGHAEARDGKYGQYSAKAESEGNKVEYSDGMSDAVDHVPETPGEDSDSIWRKLVTKMKQVANRRHRHSAPVSSGSDSNLAD